MISSMARYAVRQSDLEIICVGALTNRVAHARAAGVAPSNPEHPDGGWELVSLNPLPTLDMIDETIAVIRDLQAVFSLKCGT